MGYFQHSDHYPGVTQDNGSSAESIRREMQRQRNREYMRRKRLAERLGIEFIRIRKPKSSTDRRNRTGHCQMCDILISEGEYNGGNKEYCGDCLNEMGII